VSSLLLKVDITRAFDLVAWPFILEILAHLGFPSGWISWVSILLSTASTKVLLNGVPGDRICHASDLRQGDSLSPTLFLLVKEVIVVMIRKPDNWSLFKSLGLRAIEHRASLYTDDLVIFLSPIAQDIQTFQAILDIFAGASGLHYNMSKCQMAAIGVMRITPSLQRHFSLASLWTFY
jgi:hypothetical protein